MDEGGWRGRCNCATLTLLLAQLQSPLRSDHIHHPNQLFNYPISHSPTQLLSCSLYHDGTKHHPITQYYPITQHHPITQHPPTLPPPVQGFSSPTTSVLQSSLLSPFSNLPQPITISFVSVPSYHSPHTIPCAISTYHPSSAIITSISAMPSSSGSFRNMLTSPAIAGMK